MVVCGLQNCGHYIKLFSYQNVIESSEIIITEIRI